MSKAPRGPKPAPAKPKPVRMVPVKADADDAEALLESLNHSAERLQTLWISFILYCFYVAIAASGTTHRMLLLEEPINLPVVNLPLPLVPFYIVAPITLLVFHFYLLMMLVLLARTAKQFDDVLCNTTTDIPTRENMRFRLENSLFLQMVAGAERERKGWNGRWMQLVATTTVVAAPISALLLTQAMFIPYHSSFVTWFHRGLIVLDLLAVLCFWPSFHGKGGAGYWPRRDWRLAYIMPACLVISLFSLIVLTFPGERAHEKAWKIAMLGEDVTHCDWRAYLPPNCLSLVGQDFVDEEELAKRSKGNKLIDGDERWQALIDLTGRDLSYADFSKADMRHADFSGQDTNLLGAKFTAAWLDHSHFIETMVAEGNFDGAWLAKADLSSAHLEGSNFRSATMPSAKLNDAHLQASDFFRAKLYYAELRSAGFEGASLQRAEMQSADLEGAVLRGTDLTRTKLQGAILDNARISGSLLNSTGLEGARLNDAKIFASSILNAGTLRAEGIDLGLARNFGVSTLQYSGILSSFFGESIFPFESQSEFDAYKARLQKYFPNLEERKEFLARLSRLDPAKEEPEQKINLINKSDGTLKSRREQYNREIIEGIYYAACRIKTEESLRRILFKSRFTVFGFFRSEQSRSYHKSIVRRLAWAKEQGDPKCPGSALLTTDFL